MIEIHSDTPRDLSFAYDVSKKIKLVIFVRLGGKNNISVE
jgi:hypothetical protein